MTVGYLIIQKSQHSWKPNKIIGIEFEEYKVKSHIKKGYEVFKIQGIEPVTEVKE